MDAEELRKFKCDGKLPSERVRDAAHALLEALEDITEMYCAMINSGDCGNWNPETDKEVIKARAAIAAAKGK